MVKKDFFFWGGGLISKYLLPLLSACCLEVETMNGIVQPQTANV